MKIKGESMDWNSRVFTLLLKTDKSMINEAVELSFSQIHANRDRKRYIEQQQVHFTTPGSFLVAPTSRMAVATNSETTNPLASVLVLKI